MATSKSKPKSKGYKKPADNKISKTSRSDEVVSQNSRGLLGLKRRPKPNSKDRKPIPNVWNLTKATVKILFSNWKFFLGVTVIYGVMNMILVHGLSGATNVGQLRNSLVGASKDATSFSTSFTAFLYLIGNSGSASTSSNSGASSGYQAILILVISVALIWGLRELFNHNLIRIRDAFYKGVYPLVQFTLVLVVVGIQLLPLIIGTTLYALVMNNGIAVSTLEHIIWLIVLIVGIFISMYLICSSLFALYIVTLPDMTPIKALRSARQLVRGRRWVVIRKLLFLPLVLIIVSGIITLPFILFLTSVAGWVYLIISMFGISVIHAYMYNLYREMLN